MPNLTLPFKADLTTPLLPEQWGAGRAASRQAHLDSPCGGERTGQSRGQGGRKRLTLSQWRAMTQLTETSWNSYCIPSLPCTSKSTSSLPCLKETEGGWICCCKCWKELKVKADLAGASPCHGSAYINRSSGGTFRTLSISNRAPATSCWLGL